MEFITDMRKKQWQERYSSFMNLRKKHPNKYPIIIDRGNKHTPKPEKFKFLADSSFTLGQLMIQVRKQIPDLKPEEAVYVNIYGSNDMPCMTDMISQIYNSYHDKQDNFIYLTYCIESTFG